MAQVSIFFFFYQRCLTKKLKGGIGVRELVRRLSRIKRIHIHSYRLRCYFHCRVYIFMCSKNIF